MTRTWTERRRRTDRGPLKVINSEVTEQTFRDLQSLVRVSGKCRGEVIDALVASHMKRRAKHEQNQNT